jgi:hypothetical protein
MAATYIHAGQCPRIKLAGARGTFAEIVNEANCGAGKVIGMLRWLGAGERFDVDSLSDKHQLIYLMEGSGVITLDDKEVHVSKGAGIYLGPRETASIRHSGSSPLKVFHVVVREVEE